LERLGSGCVEDALSGERFPLLYRCLGGALADEDKAETIVQRCARDDAACEAIRLFTIWLGRVCGDLVLATTSWGGVFLTGGLVESWRMVADMDLFRAAFTDKGKMSTHMQRVATVLVRRQNVALLGLARATI
jgi:glucokinase